MGTPITNTFGAADTDRTRESLAERMYKLDPMETPFYSSIRKARAGARRHDWVGWKKTIPASNPRSEGEEVTRAPDFSVVTAPVRYNNACEILFEAFLISGSLAAVDPIGAGQV